MNRPSGKTALVTGAASGTGRAAVRLFVAEGARVTATDVSEEPLRRALAEVSDAGGEVVAHVLDVSSPRRGRRSWRWPRRRAPSTPW